MGAKQSKKGASSASAPSSSSVASNNSSTNSSNNNSNSNSNSNNNAATTNRADDAATSSAATATTSSSNRKSHSKKKTASKKKSSSSSTSTTDVNASLSVAASTHKTAAWSAKNVEKLFAQFHRLDEEVEETDDEDPADDADGECVQLSSNGLAALFDACGVDADTDEITLVFAQQCGAKTLGCISKAEFLVGLRALNADSVEQLKLALASLRRKLDASGPDRDLVSFVFDMARESDEVKTIDPQLASGLAALLLHKTAFGARLAAFLAEQTVYRGINADQWIGIWEFSRSVGADFSGYQEDGAWPIIIDEFVEWAKK